MAAAPATRAGRSRYEIQTPCVMNETFVHNCRVRDARAYGARLEASLLFVLAH